VPIRWTLDLLVVLKHDLETGQTSLQMRDASWGTGKPKKLSALALANWIKANGQSVCGKYPAVDQLRQILRTPVDLVALNDAYWKQLLEDDENLNKPSALQENARTLSNPTTCEPPCVSGFPGITGDDTLCPRLNQ
jgi:hypothetical protein